MVELAWLPVLGAGIILSALAALLAWRGARTLGAWMVVLMLLGYGELSILAGYLGGGPTTPLYRPGRWFIQAVALGAQFVLVATWPSYPALGWRRFVAVAGLVPPLLATVPIAEVLYGLSTPVSTATIAHISNWSQPFLLCFVAVPYLRLPAGALRSQFFFLLLFLMTWSGFSGVHLVVGGGSLGYVLAGVAQLLIVVGVLVAAGRNARRRWDLKSRPQDLVLIIWTTGALLVSLVPSTGNVRNFYLLNTLMLLVLFFGVARYQVLNVDFRFRSLTGESLKGAVLVPVFFVLLQIVEVESQNLLGRAGTAAGLVLGSVVSGALIFGLSRLQAFLGAGQDVPTRDEPLESYDAYRRVEMYRAAMEAAVADGVISPKEERMLSSLRASLGITREEHYALERDAKSERAKRLVTLG